MSEEEAEAEPEIPATEATEHRLSDLFPETVDPEGYREAEREEKAVSIKVSETTVSHREVEREDHTSDLTAEGDQ